MMPEERPKPKATKPRHILSVPLSPEQRAELARRAGRNPISVYARGQLFPANDNAPVAKARPHSPEKAAFAAKVLATLGPLHTSLTTIAHGLASGLLPFTPDTEAAILKACADIAAMKSLLMKALGIREAYASGRFETQAEVQRFLQNDPIFPKNRFGTVHPQKVALILTQVLYAGHMSVPEWGMYRVPAKHEALITYETFLKIDERLHGRQPVAPDRQDHSEDFPLRGFVNCACCDRPMTAAWARGSNGTRYAYYWCFTKGCGQARKNIRKLDLESAFERLIDTVRPTQELLFTAHAMLKVLWEQRETSAKEKAAHATRELQGVERKIEQLVARLVETDSRTLIEAYEAQLQKLQDQKNLLAEKASTAGRPRKSFEETFRTSFAFLSNPRVLWDSGRIEHRRKLVRLLFGGRVQYAVSEGLRTPQTTFLFKAFQQFTNDNSGVARRGG